MHGIFHKISRVKAFILYVVMTAESEQYADMEGGSGVNVVGRALNVVGVDEEFARKLIRDIYEASILS